MTLEELIQTFASHEKMATDHHERTIDRFKEDHPNEELPEHFKETFLLPTALRLMCQEILELKKK
jgi:hypothetical protein